MRFYLNATTTKVNSVSNGVFLNLYSDGYTEEDFSIKFEGEIIYKSKGWEMPTLKIFTSKKGNSIMFSESGYILNGNPISDFTEDSLKTNYTTYLSYLDAEWQEAYNCPFDDLSPYEIDDLVDELKKVQSRKLQPFEDGAFRFSESRLYEKRKIRFIYDKLASGYESNDAILWICNDGLLLDGETPTEKDKKAFYKKI